MDEEEVLVGDGAEETPEDVSGDTAQDASTEDAQAHEADVDEIVDRVVERMTPVVQDSEGRIIAHTAASMGDLGSVSLVADDYLQYVPEGAPDAVAQYLTPFLWGIAAGLVAFLIGHVWESFVRLLGLARR